MESMISHNEVRNLHEKSECLNTKICDLTEKLHSYDEEMIIKDELQKQFNELQQWIKDIKVQLKQTNSEYLSIKNYQLKKLEKSDLIEKSLNVERRRLSNVNECLNAQLKTLLRNEQILIVDKEKLETYKKILQNECDTKNQSYEESCAAVDRLSEQLTSTRDQVHGARKRLETIRAATAQSQDRCEGLTADGATARERLTECRVVARRLEDRRRELTAELEHVRSDRKDVESRAAAEEARLEAVTSALADELERRARELQRVEAECGETERRAADQRCKANRSRALAAELRAACERGRREAAERERRYGRDARRRCEDVRRLGEQLAAARADGDEVADQVTAHQTRALAYEKVLDSVRQSADARDAVHDEVRERLERDKATLSRDLQCTSAAIGELEGRVARLRGEIDARRACADPGRSDSGPPSPPPPPPAGVSASDSFVERVRRLFCDPFDAAAGAEKRRN